MSDNKANAKEKKPKKPKAVTARATYPLVLTDGDRKLTLGEAVVLYRSYEGAEPRDVFLGAVLAARKKFRGLFDSLELRNAWKIESGAHQFPLDQLAMRPRAEETSNGHRKWLTTGVLEIQQATMF